MIKKFVFVGMFLAMSAALIYGQSGIAGKWKGIDARENTVSLDLKVSGNAFTGMFTQNEGKLESHYPISGGKVTGNNISFNIEYKDTNGSNPRILPYTGKLDGDKLQLTPKFEGRVGSVSDRPVDLERVK